MVSLTYFFVFFSLCSACSPVPTPSTTWWCASLSSHWWRQRPMVPVAAQWVAVHHGKTHHSVPQHDRWQHLVSWHGTVRQQHDKQQHTAAQHRTMHQQHNEQQCAAAWHRTMRWWHDKQQYAAARHRTTCWQHNKQQHTVAQHRTMCYRTIRTALD